MGEGEGGERRKGLGGAHTKTRARADYAKGIGTAEIYKKKRLAKQPQKKSAESIVWKKSRSKLRSALQLFRRGRHLPRQVKGFFVASAENLRHSLEEKKEGTWKHRK